MRLHPAKTILFNLIWFLGSCAPLFSDMQGARLVGKRQFEITPGYSSVGIADEGYKEGVANYLGFQAAYGLSENVDLRFRFEHSWLKQSYSGESGNDIKFNVVGIGPKINLAKDRSALFLPIGIAGGYLQFQPTFLFTVPVVHNKIDFNPSVKHIVNICEGCREPLVAFNVGMALSTDISKWAIRPEYGVLYNLNAKGHFSNLSVGLSFNFSAF